MASQNSKPSNGRKKTPTNNYAPTEECLDNGSAVDHVLSYIEQYIQEHHIQIGDLLPYEDFFVQETGMSRTSVREAFGRLKALGIVASRRKRGMQLVRSNKLIDLMRLFAAETLPKALIGHIGAFRSALELGFESEIFRRATPQDISALRGIYTKMEDCSISSSEWIELDLQFHLRLIQMTGNMTAMWVSQLFRPFFIFVHDHLQFISSRTKERHLLLIRALESRDSVGFCLAMREHHSRKVNFENYDESGQVIPENEISNPGA